MTLTSDEMRQLAAATEECPTPKYALTAANALRQVADRIDELERVATAASAYFTDNPEFFRGLNQKWFDRQAAVCSALRAAGYLDGKEGWG